MLATRKLQTLQELIDNSTHEELIWMNGYLAGIVKSGSPVDNSSRKPSGKLTIVFGTDTGNSKKLATEFASKAKKVGGQVKLQSLDQYRLSDLSKEENFVVVVSTHGDGEPPLAAKKFYDHIHQNTLQLNKLTYAVLGLGDSAYPLFCKVGEDIDLRLQTLGATRLWALQKCDVDYEADANAWFDGILSTLSSSPSVQQGQLITAIPKRVMSKRNLIGTVLTNINLNGRGSSKATHHIELAAANAVYQPGDSIGIVPENPAVIVDAVMELVNIEKRKTILYRNEEIAFIDLLTKKLNIVFLPERVVSKYAAIVHQEIPPTRIDLLNLLKIYPVKDVSQFEDVIAILEPITPRLYSIASSLAAHEGEVHITVARNCFTVNGEVKHGQCSDYLSQLKENASVEFYIHKNTQFKLPSANEDIIMIGPGTGIAPFRSFIEERDSTSASGRSWLFFGDQHFESDFLYQTEIQSYLKTGALTHIDVAFSRDQEAKVYVQHKMLAKKEELYQWMEAGAYVYLCGAKEPMSVDVENTLLQIIVHVGNKSEAQALEYLLQLKESGRYQVDVY